MGWDAAADPYVRRVLEVHCGLGVRSAHVVGGHGQNNVVLVVDDAFVFRFPRHRAGVLRLEAEASLLSRLGPLLPLPVPDPRLSSFDTAAVGRAFMGYRRIPGEPLWMETLGAIDDDALRAMGDQLGCFVARLHALPLERVLPGRADATAWWTRWEDLLARVRRLLFPRMRRDARAATERTFRTFLGDPSIRGVRPTLVHGDFGTGNLLHDPEARRVTGVIDFGSARVDDPAVDLAALFWGPEAFTGGIAAAYPAVHSMRDRMRFYASTFALQEALFGAEHGDGDALRRGLAAYV